MKKKPVQRSDSLAAALDLSARVPKVQVSLRMDADLLDWLRSHGAGWTTRLNRLVRVAYRRRRK